MWRTSRKSGDFDLWGQIPVKHENYRNSRKCHCTKISYIDICENTILHKLRTLVISLTKSSARHIGYDILGLFQSNRALKMLNLETQNFVRRCFRKCHRIEVLYAAFFWSKSSVRHGKAMSLTRWADSNQIRLSKRSNSKSENFVR